MKRSTNEIITVNRALYFGWDFFVQASTYDIQIAGKFRRTKFDSEEEQNLVYNLIKSLDSDNILIAVEILNKYERRI